MIKYNHLIQFYTTTRSRTWEFRYRQIFYSKNIKGKVLSLQTKIHRAMKFYQLRKNWERNFHANKIILRQVGHSLLTLRMSHGFSSSVSEVPNAPFKFLTNLQHLDFSNNKIKSLPDTSFHFLKRIKRIELQDNEIDNIRKGTFQVGIVQFF